MDIWLWNKAILRLQRSTFSIKTPRLSAVSLWNTKDKMSQSKCLPNWNKNALAISVGRKKMPSKLIAQYFISTYGWKLLPVKSESTKKLSLWERSSTEFQNFSKTKRKKLKWLGKICSLTRKKSPNSNLSTQKRKNHSNNIACKSLDSSEC